MALTGKTVADTYKDLLTVNSTGSDNQGLENSLKTVIDGEGIDSAIQLSTTTLKIPTGKTLDVGGTLSISGTLNSVDATLTGDLTVGDDLTVTDLISGASMTLTGNMTSDSATIGGGYGDTGTTITSAGNIQTNGLLAVGGTSTLTGEVRVGGGFGDTGTTLETDGDIYTNGVIHSDSGLKINGGYQNTGSGSGGLTVNTDGSISSDTTASFYEIKTMTGKIKGGSVTPPKVDLSDDDKVKLTVMKSGANKEILTVEKDGKATFKDEDGDTKFEVTDEGTLKLKSKTTTELDALTGTAGEISFDSTVGVFKVWR